MFGKFKRKAFQFVRFNYLKEKKMEDDENSAEMDKLEVEYQLINDIKEEEDLEMEFFNNLNEFIQSNNFRIFFLVKFIVFFLEMDYKFLGVFFVFGFWLLFMLFNV